MPLKLAMLGMWHTHANGIVQQVAEHPDEFSLVGFHDPDPQVAAGRTTSASCAVSERKMSCTTKKSRSCDRMLRIRDSSGIDTAGLVAVT